MAAPTLTHDVVELPDGGREHRIVVDPMPNRPEIYAYRAEIRECTCDRKVCTTWHKRWEGGRWGGNYVTDPGEIAKCERTGGTCHSAWHPAQVATYLAALERTYMPAGRKHTPRLGNLV